MTTFHAPTPLQYGIERSLRSGHGLAFARAMAAVIEDSAKRMRAVLEAAGLPVSDEGAGCFVITDVRDTGLTDVEWCKVALEGERGVGCAPVSIFFSDPDTAPKNLVRIAVCKSPELIDEACKRLKEKLQAGWGCRVM